MGGGAGGEGVLLLLRRRGWVGGSEGVGVGGGAGARNGVGAERALRVGFFFDFAVVFFAVDGAEEELAEEVVGKVEFGFAGYGVDHLREGERLVYVMVEKRGAGFAYISA